MYTGKGISMGLLTLLARRFVAGQNISNAMKAVKALNDLNIMATIDYLGEDVTSVEDATKAADEYIRLLDEIDKQKLDSNVSLKMTMMGLDFDPEFCYKNVKRIVEQAAKYDNFVRIDMEGSPVTQITLDLFYRLRAEHPNVGIVIQSYLYRTEKDAIEIAEKGYNVRLCKGAYKEKEDVAFQKKEKVNENYLDLAKILLDGNGKTAIATHDRKMIEPLRDYIQQKQIRKDMYEWQMLYGIERKLQTQLAKDGEPVRVYVPYGDDWLGYFSRRMMERKENFFFALRHFIRG